MRDLGKIVAHIPARAGSKRVKAKNLRIINNKPLLSYSVECALKTGLFEEVVVNSDSDEMLLLGKSLGAIGYKRNAELASDDASGDAFTYDFIKVTKPDTLVMISPVCPLIHENDVINAIKAFKSSDCDTLITCDSTQMQTFCHDKAVNIDLNSQLAPTQENPTVNILNWAVTIWDAKAFVKNFDLYGSAYIGKNRLLFPIDPIHSVKISKESDFVLAEALLKSQEIQTSSEIKYWSSSMGDKL